MYVSITGLRLKGWRHAPLFWWLALRSFRQARKAPGNLGVEARMIDGVHHTMSVWTDQSAMRDYLVRGPHMAAMKSFHAIATGAVLGFTAEQPPPWCAVHALWLERGRDI